MTLDCLLDVHQVAAIMRIHHKKVQRLARTGVLPCIKVGAVYRFRAAALEAWMETHEVSERKSTQAGPVVGVSLSRQIWDQAPEDAIGCRISLVNIGEDCPPGAGVYLKRPLDDGEENAVRTDC